jgi:hypothetical protein
MAAVVPMCDLLHGIVLFGEWANVGFCVKAGRGRKKSLVLLVWQCLLGVFSKLRGANVDIVDKGACHAK